MLEIGPGKGANLAYPPPGIRWIGLEPNPSKHEQPRRAASAHGHPGVVVRGVAERMPLADHSLDAVVGTMVLCSVADQARALAEIRRVLRPGGRFVFLEHVAAAPGTWSRVAQAIWAPVSRRFQGGCDPSRDTLRAIDQAGFAQVSVERFTLRGPLHVEDPHIVGYAHA